MIKCLSSFTLNQSCPPSGFKVITSGPRCVILIWEDNQIRTLKFDDIAASVEANTPCQKVYDYRFTEQSEVKAIISTATNTFGLLEDGRIFYFVSFRAVEIIPDLKNVRVICRSDNGFVLIRNISPVDVSIEFYSDRSSSEMLKKYKKIPIGWNERWTFERSTERSILCLIRNEDDSPTGRLFTKLVDADVERHSKIVLFSVNSSLFCIFYENAKDIQSEVCQIRTFLTDIKSVWVFASGIMCILLDGVIDILYEDSGGTLRKDSLFSGLNDILAHEVVMEDECVYLSDGRLCMRVALHRDSNSIVTWTMERFELSGIIGLSFLPGVVLCLSENCFIYTIGHQRNGCNKAVVELPMTNDINIEKLQSTLGVLADRNEGLLEETAKSTVLNVIMNPQVLADNCRTILIFSANCDSYEMPSLADRNSEQLYDIQLEFESSPELESIFKSWDWRLAVMVRGIETYREVITIDEKFIKCKRIKILRDCARDNGTLGSDFEISIQSCIGEGGELLIDVPLLVTYKLNPLIQILDEDPLELQGKWKFTLQTDKPALMNKIFKLIIETRLGWEPFVIAIGRSPIVVNSDGKESIFSSDDQGALQLFKKLLLLQSHNLGYWTRVQYESMETIAVGPP